MGPVTTDTSPVRRPPERRADGARFPRLTGLLRALCHDLFVFPVHPMPSWPRVTHPLLRRLPLILTVLLATDLAIPGAMLLAERLDLVWPLAAALSVAQTAPVVLALTRPMAAWWISLAAALPYAIGLAVQDGGTPADGAPWPWAETQVMAHLAVTLIAAWRVAPRVYLAQWGITLLFGGALSLTVPPRAAVPDAAALLLFSAVGLAIVAAVRGRSEIRQQLKRQQALTEQERTRRTLLEERTRIARELHDVVAHHMSVIAVQAEAAPYRVADPPPELSDSFAGIRANALSALTELRHILGMLRSADPTPDGRRSPQPTLADIDELVANVRSAGLRIEASVTGVPRPLSRHLELSAYRIVQEALSNALRHAPGCRVEFELSYGPAGLGIRVANSPATAAVPPPDGAGHGVVGMRERAAVLGGALDIGPREDGWFEVTASLPLGKDEDA
ncbi:sensor histidine kinase [Streptomyces celluloflavus]|uniref:sensor histidine kinase n=1 Tax=Streptomyces celluloflavus TaxID=58344 RepID=UPI0036ADD3DF